MLRSMQFMFWVLFANDNVDKSQSEVHSALAAAKIEQKLNSTGLHLFQLSFFLLVLVESSAVQPKMCTHRDHKITFRTTYTV